MRQHHAKTGPKSSNHDIIHTIVRPQKSRIACSIKQSGLHRCRGGDSAAMSNTCISTHNHAKPYQPLPSPAHIFMASFVTSSFRNLAKNVGGTPLHCDIDVRVDVKRRADARVPQDVGHYFRMNTAPQQECRGGVT